MRETGGSLFSSLFCARRDFMAGNRGLVGDARLQTQLIFSDFYFTGHPAFNIRTIRGVVFMETDRPNQ